MDTNKLLLEAADFVESIPDNEFNMGHWWLEDGIAYDDMRNKMYKAHDGKCGCAIGHMGQNNKFGITTSTYAATQDIVFPRIGDKFGIPSDVAQFIFDQYSYPTGSLIGAKAKKVCASRLRYLATEYQDGI